jgi:4-oxalocrotonate tautomerase
MPHITIQITKDDVTRKQKNALIKGATDLMVDVLGKDPALTFVLIEEVETDNWGVAGVSVTDRRGGQR